MELRTKRTKLILPALPSDGDADDARALGERVQSAVVPYHNIQRAKRDSYRGFDDHPGVGICAM